MRGCSFACSFWGELFFTKSGGRGKLPSFNRLGTAGSGGCSATFVDLVTLLRVSCDAGVCASFLLVIRTSTVSLGDVNLDTTCVATRRYAPSMLMSLTPTRPAKILAH